MVLSGGRRMAGKRGESLTHTTIHGGFQAPASAARGYRGCVRLTSGGGLLARALRRILCISKRPARLDSLPLSVVPPISSPPPLFPFKRAPCGRYTVKAKKTMAEPVEGVTKNGRPIVKGRCPYCGAAVCRIGKAK